MILASGQINMTLRSSSSTVVTRDVAENSFVADVPAGVIRMPGSARRKIGPEP